MVQNHSLGDLFENGKEFLSKLIPDKILETVLCRNFAKNRLFLGGFWLTVLEQDMGTTQILYHSQTKLSAVISRIFRGAMDSSFFREWCTNQPHFLKKSEFRNYEPQDRDCWSRIIN